MGIIKLFGLANEKLLRPRDTRAIPQEVQRSEKKSGNQRKVRESDSGKYQEKSGNSAKSTGVFQKNEEMYLIYENKQ